MSPTGQPERELERWRRWLSLPARRRHPLGVRRVVVVAEAGSTQDVARAESGGLAGVLVVAGRQTAGRGRLGRAWADTSHLGVAVTFVLDARRWPVDRLSLASGLAACLTVERALAGAQSSSARQIGLRWPNDAVEANPDRSPGRKIAGVLIERVGDCALVGIGINALHGPSDWPVELRGRAVSLHELGSGWSRLRVIWTLWWRLEWVLARADAELEDLWLARDLLVGTRQTFVHDGRRVTGKVERIDPSNCILVRGDDGSVRRLPALTTSLEH